ncbi:hypothetical protein JXB01_00180 [Candidatus Micrarchaeota archaeon]|nr:hypothetical protein [Candidatus Micrarchaeota archaeon]
MPLEIPGIAWTLIAISMLFSTIWAVLIYLLGEVVGTPIWKMNAKEELSQLVLSIFIVGFIVVGWGALSSITSAVFGVENLNYLKVADLSLLMLQTNFLHLYRELYLYEAVIAILSSISIPLGTFPTYMFIFNLHMVPFGGLTLLTNAHILLVDSMAYATTAIIAKRTILAFAVRAVPTVVLPLGLVMRSFAWFRKTGSTLIALSLAMFFVFPLSVTLSNYVIFDVFKPSVYFLNFEASPGSATLCTDDPDDLENKMDELNEIFLKETEERAAVKAAGAEVEGEGEFFILKIFDFIGNVGDTIADVFSGIWDILGFLYHLGPLIFTPMSYLHIFYVYLVEELILYSEFIIVGLVTTVLEFIITVTAYRSFSAALAGETEVFGLSKIV